jgi:CRISPR-associated protein Cas5 subtype I-B
MDEKIFVFRLSGNFAHFNIPLTTPKYLKQTYNIIPKTTILGLLGAILGYSGYERNNKETEFYSKLKHIKCFIIPEKYPFNKFLIKYNSLNSFSNNDKTNPNIIINEEILFKPSYIIGLLINESKDNQLINKLIQKISHYHLYLGKNEFFANIELIKSELLNFEIVNNKETKIDSIFPVSILKNSSDEIKSIILDQFQSSLEFTKDFFYPNCIDIGYLKEDKDKNKELIEINLNFNLIKISSLDKIVYLF